MAALAADVALAFLALVGASSVLIVLALLGAAWRHTAIDRRVNARMATATDEQRTAEMRATFAELIAAERHRSGWEVSA